ncbi:unnamed protein product, partial [Heterosigma akashiwo]
MGSGRVCHDFVQAMKIVEGAKVVAVCSRSLLKANEFANLHRIPRAYGSYEELARDPEIDVIYVGSLHTFHLYHASLALKHGKHCLCEKPLACNVNDARFLLGLARRNDLFIMEGMWTRFFPAVQMAKNYLEGGRLGNVVAVHSDFGFHYSDCYDYPQSDIFRPEMAGGALLNHGVYPLSMAPFAFRSQGSTKISATGIVDDFTKVDMCGSVNIQYGSAGIAVLTYNLMAETDEETSIIGTTGRLRLNSPGHCPTSITIIQKGSVRGQTITETFEFPLPQETPEIIKSGGFNYPNSIGFSYEAQAVVDCINAGRLECLDYPHKDMLQVMGMCAEIQKQIKI